MKYMKIGILPDSFYTEEAARSVQSDVPTDLTIQVNNTRYLLHKFPLLQKCGLLQRLCPDHPDNSSKTALVLLHDIPGGAEAFELCAKFCYGIAIKLSARNFVPTICAAKFLRMTESVSKGNLVTKLESFFNTCIIQGWKDSIIALQATRKFLAWSENLGIVQRCTDSIIQKIITVPSKVTWSYTYTRPGYNLKQHKSTPKDWWTEDVSDLDLEIFQSIILSIRLTKQLPAPLLGEVLHVYVCKHLDDLMDQTATRNCKAHTKGKTQKQSHILESVVSMIPVEDGAVTGGFVLRLLKIGNFVGASPSTMAELVQRAGHQLHEAKASDLLFPSPLKPKSYDVDLVMAVLEAFLSQFCQPISEQAAQQIMASMQTVAKTIDYYLQAIAHDPDLPVNKIVELAGSLPDVARPDHNSLYCAIDIYLKEHPELCKMDKKQLCQILDCRKLSCEMCSHAVRNENLPLRTIVQVLFIAQSGAGCSQNTPQAHPAESCLIATLRGIGSADESMAKRVERGCQPFCTNESKLSRIERSTIKLESEAIMSNVRDTNIKEGQASNSKHK